MSGANRFYNAIGDVSSLRSSDLIGYFVYYLTVEAGDAYATATAVDACFSDCDLPSPGNTSAYLSKNLNGKPPKFVKVTGGYRLQRDYRNELSQGLGEIRVTAQTSSTLRQLEIKLSSGLEKAFLSELIDCFEVGASRAAIVMCWILTLDHLQEYVFMKHLPAFNAVLAKNTDKRVRVAQITTRDDFGDVPESKFIEFLRSAGVISNDVRKILDVKLGIRNSSAHPSSVAVKPSKAVEFIDDLVENVVLKYKL